MAAMESTAVQTLTVPAGTPAKSQLKKLEAGARAARKRLRQPDSEVRLPLFIEFSGSPKSGKTTVIGIVAHFLRRMQFAVDQPAEGASLRTPSGLRDDWLAFNAWSGCYALQHVLVDCSTDPPSDLVLLDRGLFDLAGWMEFLCSSQQRIAPADRDRIVNFFTLDLWRQRENAVFLFTADHATSMYREDDNKLTSQPGSVMNKETLAQLRDAYSATAGRWNKEFNRLYHVDTSFRKGRPPSFQQIAYVVAAKIIDTIEELSTQMLLVTEPVSFGGFVTDPETRSSTVARILKDGQPTFVDRDEAEETTRMQQVVPYAVLVDESGRYFWARRRADVRRKELQRRHTILVGGHAERRDWDPQAPAAVFEQCLRRELEEELIGIRILDTEPLGFIHDTRNRVGALHLAFIHRVRVGGRTVIRRQAIDQEFGRESVSWKTEAEIRDSSQTLDPWSQLVAAELFGAPVPDADLFTNNVGRPRVG